MGEGSLVTGAEESPTATCRLEILGSWQLTQSKAKVPEPGAPMVTASVRGPGVCPRERVGIHNLEL